MITKNARKVLKYFIKVDDEQTWCDIVLHSHLSKQSVKTSDIVSKGIDDLLDAGCIKISSYSAKGDIYVLTNAGKTYFKQRRQEWLKSLLNGVAFPIIVALITALVTTMLTIYLSQLGVDKQNIEIECNCNSDTETSP